MQGYGNDAAIRAQLEVLQSTIAKLTQDAASKREQLTAKGRSLREVQAEAARVQAEEARVQAEVKETTCELGAIEAVLRENKVQAADLQSLLEERDQAAAARVCEALPSASSSPPPPERTFDELAQDSPESAALFREFDQYFAAATRPAPPVARSAPSSPKPAARSGSPLFRVAGAAREKARALSPQLTRPSTAAAKGLARKVGSKVVQRKASFGLGRNKVGVGGSSAGTSADAAGDAAGGEDVENDSDAANDGAFSGC